MKIIHYTITLPVQVSSNETKTEQYAGVTIHNLTFQIKAENRDYAVKYLARFLESQVNGAGYIGSFIEEIE